MKPTLAALVLIAALATGCAGIGPGAKFPAGKQIDSAVLAEIDQGAQEIPIFISLLPAGELQSVDEETAKTSPGLPSPEAIEAKELKIARAAGKQIDETRLAALEEGLKAKSAVSYQKFLETSAAVSAHNAQQFKVNYDKFTADAAKIPGLRVLSFVGDGDVSAIGTGDAIKQIAALPYVSGILSNRPVQVHPG